MLWLRRIWAIWFAFWFLAFFVLLSPFFILFIWIKPLRFIANKLRRIWAWLCAITAGISFKKSGATVHCSKQYIVVANHFSYLDILSLAAVLPLNFSFMAKNELSKAPVLALFLKTIDVEVDRKKGRKYALLNITNRLEQGFSPIIFPEGTTNRQVPKLLNFHTGAFRLAQKTGVEILPISILNNHQLMPYNGWVNGLIPGISKIFVHEPFSIENCSSIELKQKMIETKSIIENKLLENENNRR